MFYISLIQKYRDTLVSKIELMEKVLAKAPEGDLKIERRSGYYFYGVRTKQDQARPVHYIRKSDSIKLKQYANKRLAKDSLKVLKQNLRAAESFLKYHSGKDITAIAESYPPELQQLNANLIRTGWLIDKKWAEETYRTNPFRTEELLLNTKKGCMVRSKSEMFISDILYTQGILYRYECMLDLQDGKPPLYPDFTILHPKTKKIIYWEHFGRMSDKSYCDDACRKINRYLEAGFLPGENLIFSFESEGAPMNYSVIEKIAAEIFS